MQLQNYREWCVQECVPLFPLPLLEFEMVEHKWIPHGIKTLIWYCHESNQHLYSASILKREKNGRIIHKVKKDFKKSIYIQNYIESVHRLSILHWSNCNPRAELKKFMYNEFIYTLSQDTIDSHLLNYSIFINTHVSQNSNDFHSKVWRTFLITRY